MGGHGRHGVIMLVVSKVVALATPLQVALRVAPCRHAPAARRSGISWGVAAKAVMQTEVWRHRVKVLAYLATGTHSWASFLYKTVLTP